MIHNYIMNLYYDYIMDYVTNIHIYGLHDVIKQRKYYRHFSMEY